MQMSLCSMATSFLSLPWANGARMNVVGPARRMAWTNEILPRREQFDCPATKGSLRSRVLPETGSVPLGSLCFQRFPPRPSTETRSLDPLQSLISLQYLVRTPDGTGVHSLADVAKPLFHKELHVCKSLRRADSSVGERTSTVATPLPDCKMRCQSQVEHNESTINECPTQALVREKI